VNSGKTGKRNIWKKGGSWGMGTGEMEIEPCPPHSKLVTEFIFQNQESGNQENQEMKKNQESGNQENQEKKLRKSGIRIRKSGNFLIFIFQNQIHKISKFSTC
jgi:hypothetical protein